MTIPELECTCPWIRFRNLRFMCFVAECSEEIICLQKDASIRPQNLKFLVGKMAKV
jgi:hypothetical protein